MIIPTGAVNILTGHHLTPARGHFSVRSASVMHLNTSVSLFFWSDRHPFKFFYCQIF